MANESRINLAIHRSLQCLADVYRVRRDLFREMNRPIWPLIKPDNPNRRSLTDKELELIIEFWGLPDKDYCFGVDPLVYRTIRRLSVLYHVSVPTMRQWIKKILPGIKPEIHNFRGTKYFNRRHFTPKEVRAIIDKLGIPPSIKYKTNDK